ncbi:hypothetical protein Tco_0969778 [Tanacetum coccineum]
MDALKQDRASIIAKVVPDAATKLIRSDEMGMLVVKLIKAFIIYGRCAAFEEVSKLKESFIMKKMAGYRPSSKQEYDQDGDDLANASYPFLSKYVSDPNASLEQLLSKKPESLCSKPSSFGRISSFKYSRIVKLPLQAMRRFILLDDMHSPAMVLRIPPRYWWFRIQILLRDVSARKSASICPLIEFLPLNSISSSELPCGVHEGKVFMKGRDLSALFERNLFRAANYLLKLCISLTVFGGCRADMAFTLEGSELIARSLLRVSSMSANISSSESLFKPKGSLLRLGNNSVGICGGFPPPIQLQVKDRVL